MSRSTSVALCIVLGLLLLGSGLLLPAHLRAVDDRVLERAGRNTPGIIEEGVAMINRENLGAAQMLLDAARQKQIQGHEKLEALIAIARRDPERQPWGSSPPLAMPNPGTAHTRLSDTNSIPSNSSSLTDLMIRAANREKVLDLMAASPRPDIQEMVRFRNVTNTALFPPAQSASGQALDTSLAICGLLLESGQLSPALSRQTTALAAEANAGQNTQPFEELLMNLLSLGQRLDWGQLTVFLESVNDPEALGQLTGLVRKAGPNLPVVFAAVQMSGNAAGVSRYLQTYSKSGLNDLGWSLRYRSGAVKELVERNKRLHRGGFSAVLGAGWGQRSPGVVLALKWVLYFASGFLLAMAVHFARRPASVLERPLQVRGFHVAREILFALGFLLVVLLLSEPFLAQDSQRAAMPFRLRLPTVGNAVPAGTTSLQSFVMNQLSILAMLLFFVLQALLYTACLFKLAEIRRQRVPPRMKLKLLENEDHLFDAGLYLGFVGTIISLILVSVNVIQPSLMAAYSATSFGIIFVSIFKIFNLRPVRRRLLLEAEAEARQPLPASGQPLAVHL